jgi:hypothetical protein
MGDVDLFLLQEQSTRIHWSMASLGEVRQVVTLFSRQL